MRYLFILWLTLAQSAIAQEIEVTVDGEHGPLFGTFQQGAGDIPPMLIIPGSGPIDRNGLRKDVVGPGIYQRLADAFGRQGQGTFRIDKRGTFASTDAIRTTDDLRIAGYARDVRAWIDYMRLETDQPCIWVLGHSEGGLVGMVAARDDPAGICGLILVAAPGRHIDEILREQLERYTKSNRVRQMIDNALTELKAGREVNPENLPLLLKVIFSPVNQRYFMDWMTYDPAEVIRDIKVPVLIIQGTTDVQISVEDAKRLKAALPAADLEIVDGVNHNLLQSSLTFPPKGTPFSGRFFDVFADFLIKNELNP